MRIAAKVTDDGAGRVELAPSEGDGRRVVSYLGTAAPWARPRRLNGRVTLSVVDALRLESEGQVEFDMDADGRQFMANRRRIREAAAGVLEESRRITAVEQAKRDAASPIASYMKRSMTTRRSM